jgi:hypothetical protein
MKHGQGFLTSLFVCEEKYILSNGCIQLQQHIASLYVIVINNPRRRYLTDLILALLMMMIVIIIINTII